MSYDYAQAFTEGHNYNKLVADYLRSCGIKCTVPDLKIAKNSKERREMTLQEKDIIIDATGQVIEVKSNRRSFGWNPENFPYDKIIVDTIDSFESKEVKPVAYVFVSRDTGAMVTIGVSSKARWGQAMYFDKYQKINENFYVAKKEEIKPMIELVRYLTDSQNTQKRRGRNSGRLLN